MDARFSHATVVTQDAGRRLLRDASVAVRSGRIVAVGPDEDVARAHPDLPEVPSRERAILPGLVNAHTHLLLLALRGTIEDAGIETIYRYMTPISFAMTDDERRAIGRLGCLEALRSGTTTLVEPFRHVANYAGAMADTGMRLWFSESCADALTLKIRHGIYEFDDAWGETFLERAAELFAASEGKALH